MNWGTQVLGWVGDGDTGECVKIGDRDGWGSMVGRSTDERERLQEGEDLW